MVAGLTSAFARHAPPVEALRLGLACGSATAQKPGTQLFDPADVKRLVGRIEVRELDA
jgi:6-phosphofructokinase 2